VARRTPLTSDHAFLLNPDPRGHSGAAVSVDVVVLTVREGRLCVLLVRRGTPPLEGSWALPGGFVGRREDLDAAARRELADRTGLAPGAAHLEQLASYGDPDRDPRMRVVSVAYLALVPGRPRPDAVRTDAVQARFWPVTDLSTADAGRSADPVTGDGGPSTDRDAAALAFDHDRILADAVERARSKLEYTSLAVTFLEQPFTLADLRRVYEAVWGRPLHPANFRRKVLSTPGLVVPTGEERATGRGWADLYTAGPTRPLHPALLRPGPDLRPDPAGPTRPGPG
jgi:8-oxo-dGTP diphosphatase